MRKKLIVFFVGLMFLSLQGCSLDGACEYSYTFGSTNYYCDNVSDSGILPLSGTDICYLGHTNTFHEGSSCSSIGYDYPSDIGDYQYDANANASPYGAYAYAATGSYGGYGGGSGGGSGGGATCDPNTTWTGAANDIQVSTVCQSACVYVGYNQQGVDASCGILAGYGASAVASCSACP